VAEQCSRHRIKGAHGLSPSINLRTSSASLRAAGVGELHRKPEELAPAEAGGHSTANMVLPTFAKTKVGRLPWRNPANCKRATDPQEKNDDHGLTGFPHSWE